MLGYIKKDLFAIRSTSKYLLILIIIFVIMAYSGSMDLSFIIPFTCIALMMTTFNFDAYSKWDTFTATLPNGLKTSVKAKYLLTLSILILAVLVASLLSLLFSYQHTGTIDFQLFLIQTCGSLFATILTASIIYPIIYKFGTEKAGIGILLFILGIAVAIGFLTKYLDFTPILNLLIPLANILPIILLLTSLILFFISYQISAKIFTNKEL